VASAKFSDAAGNQNADGSEANNTASIAVDTAVPVFSSLGTANAQENQPLLYTAVATDSTAVSYALTGTDASLLNIGTDGKVTLKSGNLDFDAANAKKTYSFSVDASDVAGNKATLAVVVSVTNVTSDDGGSATPVAVVLDNLNPAGTQTTPATFDAGTGAFAFSDDFTKMSYFQISNFGSDDTIAYPGTLTPELLSVANAGTDVQLLVNNNGTVSSIILKNTSSASDFITSVSEFNALAVGNIISVGATQYGSDTTPPVFTSSSTVSAAENQPLLYTAVATDSTAVTYALTGTDASLLNIGTDGKVTLKSGNLDFDAANAKKTYSFNVDASDVAGNKATLAVVVSVTNVTSDDVATPTRTAVALDSLNPAGTQTTPATFDAGTGAFAFSDDFTKMNYFQILNFGSDDTLAYPGSISADLLSVANTGTDVQLLVNNNGTVSSIIFKNACNANDFIASPQDFNSLPVGNIVSVGAVLFA